ncbi:Asp-tRNA(Asn)/Glu-tRNA(Gln) amidotransferase subunit GatB [Candidatus Clavichlamydia salmonicola]|uniref:Asp-tRNA(Asn)/Glu-tRNA(Gln) amidotransferase subunit GatB n=1 Tax=Candidatus Clavichlamydia salmonicola TaxID=469812 RepID=UPI0018915914|nr:Asp-tRNA(Asn)/Glu-tRNA(Gln) amidotransferase subunit GatB [Candidatus Clavichlamydia salmonicola]
MTQTGDIYGDWEPVIGLEVHIELNTQSKLFSTALNHFGDVPNTNISIVCTGQPGALPVLNQEAVRKAVAFGCAVGGDVSTVSYFDRKAYFYPDSPRNFQITQFHQPIVKGGSITALVHGEEKIFTLHQTHIEDDAGMLKHSLDFAGVDYNRAGVPLIEVVSDPCIFSPAEAIAYATSIRLLVDYLGISDCNMEEGSLRFDANISVRKKGEQELRNKIEIKNMNSFTFMGMALEAEIKRQIREYRSNPEKAINEVIIPATYRWDAEKKTTVLMRSKESAEDYRYFREPDLPTLILSHQEIEEVRQSLPEFPYAKYQRYMKEFGLPDAVALILTEDKHLAAFFEKAVNFTQSYKVLANWITVEFIGRFKNKEGTLLSSGVVPQHIAEMVEMIESGKITGKMAKGLVDLMIESPGVSPQELVRGNEAFEPLMDQGILQDIIVQVVASNPTSVSDYKEGKKKALAFLVGQVMKATQGKAAPGLVNELLLAALID